MSAEAKVGAFTLGGAALLVAVIIFFGGLRFGGGHEYTLYAGFGRAIGLNPEAQVLLSGVPVGRVQEVASDGTGVTVAMTIQDGVKIPRGSSVTIAQPGIMGDKFVIITPSASKNYYAAGDYLYGSDEMGMDSMFTELNKMIVQVEDMLTGINNIVGAPGFQMSVVQLAVNMEHMTAHLDGLTATLEQMAAENRGNLSGTIAHMNAMAANLARTTASVERIVTNLETVGADPATAENLRQTLANITEASGRIARIAEGIESVTGDKQTQEDARALIHNARTMSEKANGLMGRLGSIKVTPKIDAMYSGKADDWRTNFNLDIGEAKGMYATFGVDDIGGGDKFNAQVGMRGPAFGARAGVVAGAAGIGVDAYAGEKFKFSADAYDPDDVTVRLRAQYQVHGGTYLFGEWNDVNDRKRRAFYTGVRQEF
ncbi:MlaD family protein [Selenomonas sp. F0473]|uniref:MlaD family protein n=1 Tax=Selenomonas sp. F0473 TaxID=999423 RepID=UPI00029E077A|nr:MlaD family protein [Selenomonas sp. F0473]EKU72172.1 virulence factor Mce family protein [Selenomonas sp. F0473]